MQAVILAAGKGTRLQPISETRSKAMAPVAGQPMVERVMAGFVANGIHDFILVISDDDAEIGPYFQSQTKLKATFQFVTQTERLGMANALSLAAPYLNQPFIVSACDSIVPESHVANLISTYNHKQANGVLSLMEMAPERISKSSAVAWQNGHICKIVEKPDPTEAPSNQASLPLYLFSPCLLNYLSEVPLSARGEYELQDAIQMLIDRDGRVTGVLTQERIQLTNIADLLSLNRHYLGQQVESHIEAATIGAGTQFNSPVYVDSGTIIGTNCKIGPNVFIETGCHIGNNVIIADAVILRDTVIDDDQKVLNTALA